MTMGDPPWPTHSHLFPVTLPNHATDDQGFVKRDDQIYSVGHPSMTKSQADMELEEIEFYNPTTVPATSGMKAGEIAPIITKHGVGITKSVKGLSTYLNGLQPHELARLAEPQPNEHTHEPSIAETMAPGRVVNVAKPKPPADEREYRAEWGDSGEAFLVLTSRAVLAKFDTFADAQLAAEALNNHKGY